MSDSTLAVGDEYYDRWTDTVLIVTWNGMKDSLSLLAERYTKPDLETRRYAADTILRPNRTKREV